MNQIYTVDINFLMGVTVIEVFGSRWNYWKYLVFILWYFGAAKGCPGALVIIIIWIKGPWNSSSFPFVINFLP